MKTRISNNSRSTRNAARFLATTLALSTSLFSQLSTAQETGIEVIDKGEGPALVFIPGLNSGRDTFTSTCEAVVATHRCLLVELPGFAGQSPMNLQNGFLEPVKDEVIQLLRDKQLSGVTLVGHSLGGLVSLMVTLEAPELIEQIVVIDTLPFYPAMQIPAMTVAMAKPQAEAMRVGMNAQSDADYQKNASASVTGMSNNPERLPLLIEWSQASDRATTTTAMYEMMTTDLRSPLADIKQPLMVLGSWAAYKPYGSTMESTKSIFATQYAQYGDVDIRMSETGFHFLTWDDSSWVNQQIINFIEQ